MGSTIGPASTPAPTTPASPAAVHNLPGEEVLPLEVLIRHAETVDLLYRAHRDAGRVLARSLSQNQRDAEDIFQEAFTATIKTLNVGGGAPKGFAAQLNTAIRGIAATWNEPGRYGFVPVAPSPSRDLDAPPGLALPASGGTVLDEFPGYTRLQDVLTALQTLPGRWQEVLWCADVLGEAPGDIAARLDITSEAVEFLIARAHAGLRKAYQVLHPSRHHTGQR